MSARATLVVALALCAAGAMPRVSHAQRADSSARRVLDTFDSTNGWGTFPAEGVALTLRESAGASGNAMTLDFDFQGKAGYAIARKAFAIGTPSGNWAFSFKTRGSMKPNTLEFKLLDKSGDNVWWYTIPEFQPGSEWQTVAIRQRQVSFAWGPIGGGPPRDIANIEIVVTAGQGGAGTLTIDDLVFQSLPADVAATNIARVSASGTAAGSDARFATDRDSSTVWRAALAASPSLTLDLGGVRTYGGLVIAWSGDERAASVVADTSNNGTDWQEAGRLLDPRGARSHLPVRDGSSRYVRLRFSGVPANANANASPGAGATAVVGVRDVAIRPLAFAATPTNLLHAIAADAPRGAFPRSLHDEQNYWTIVGVSGGKSEALLSEDGQLELATRGPSLEPFLQVGNTLVTWADVTPSQSLLDGVRPIPSVTWTTSAATLTVTAFAAGSEANSSIYGRYRVVNRGRSRLSGTLWLALRPIQVNPPQQFLNTPGGAARVDSIAWDGSVLRINDALRVTPLTQNARVGVAALDGGEAVEWVARGVVPSASRVTDPRGLASAVMSWPLDVAPGDSADVVVASRLDGSGDPDRVTVGSANAVRGATARRLAQVARTWVADQDAVTIHLPKSAPPIADAIKANLAYILINRDGPGIQPGSRSYERSWIRDGTLTSEALLRLGRSDEAKRFAEWYAQFQYPSGKIPCCVDARGADPVDEHDSHGEFIHLVYEVFRFTGDTAFAKRMWPHVKLAAGFIDSLRKTHLTPAYDTDSLRAFRGLMPASISHEGYSAKPMHSVWDDGFALLGLREAESLARLLREPLLGNRVVPASAQFGTDLEAALDRTMRAHEIPFIPGSIELGDFDATSTTTLITPGGLLPALPSAAFDSTFARYYRYARGRAKPDSVWENYTPYEWRTVGAMLRLGMKEQALAMVDQFMADRRPLAWQQWAEVVWRNKRDAKFIGDMPHTWVGSDFIRSALDLFAYEDAGCGDRNIVRPEIRTLAWVTDYSSPCLVIGAGIPRAWTPSNDSIAVHGLRTSWGPVGYTMRVRDKAVTIRLDAGLRMPPRGIVLRTPLTSAIVSATIDGKVVPASELVNYTRRGTASFSLAAPARVIVLTYR